MTHFVALYYWVRIALFCGGKMYRWIVFGEKNWEYERLNITPYGGEYFFKDSPLSSEEDFPDLARGEMAKSISERPSWVSD